MKKLSCFRKNAKFGELNFAVDRIEYISREFIFVVCNKSVYFTLNLEWHRNSFHYRILQLSSKISHICSIVHLLRTVWLKNMTVVILVNVLFYEHHAPTKVNLFLFFLQGLNVFHYGVIFLFWAKIESYFQITYEGKVLVAIMPVSVF